MKAMIQQLFKTPPNLFGTPRHGGGGIVRLCLTLLLLLTVSLQASAAIGDDKTVNGVTYDNFQYFPFWGDGYKSGFAADHDYEYINSAGEYMGKMVWVGPSYGWAIPEVSGKNEIIFRDDKQYNLTLFCKKGYFIRAVELGGGDLPGNLGDYELSNSYKLGEKDGDNVIFVAKDQNTYSEWFY